MEKYKRTYEATIALLRKGENTEEKLQRYLVKKRKAKVYDISKELNWSIGKVHSTIARLEKKGLVETKLIIENSRVKKVVSLTPYKELLA